MLDVDSSLHISSFDVTDDDGGNDFGGEDRVGAFIGQDLILRKGSHFQLGGVGLVSLGGLNGERKPR